MAKTLTTNERMGFGIQANAVKPTDVRHVYWSPTYDQIDDILTVADPVRVRSLFRQVDSGDYSILPRLAMEFERRDSQIRMCAVSRRMALTAVDWEILPNQEAQDQNAAEDAASYCMERLRGIYSFRKSVNHLVRAITDGVAAVELIWESSELVDLVPVPYTRLRSQYPDGPEIWMTTDDNYTGQPMPWGKFCVWAPDHIAPHPLGATIVHAASILFVFKSIARADWSTFLDVYGVPARVLMTTTELPEERLSRIKDALRELSSDFYAVLHGMDEKAQLTTFNPGTSPDVFSEAMAWADDAIAKLYLMQTLTSDVRDSGSRALGEIHQNVRADLLASDMMAESDNIEANILRPMIMGKFPDRPDMPIPWFRRKLIEKKNIEAERLMLDQLEFAARRGMHIDDNVLYERLNIPIPTTKPETSKTDQEVAITVNELTLGIERATRAGDIDLVNALRAKIAEHLNVALPPLSELPEKTPAFGGAPEDKIAEDKGEDEGEDDEDDVPATEARTIREQVIEAIDRRWLGLKEIMVLTQLPYDQVKGVLCCSDMQTRIRKRKSKGKPTEYRLAR